MIMKFGAASGRTGNPGAPPKTMRRIPGLAVAEVEVVDDRDKNLGRAAADNAASSAAAHTTWDSAGATATDEEATRSRLGELHRLLNNRKGSLSATYKM